MNTQLVQIFIDTARLGSFAAVARELDTDPSSISRQIASLEAQLGYRLFERTTRRLALTEAGQLTFDRIQAPLEEIKRVQSQAQDIVYEPQGNLRLSASTSFAERWLVPRLSGFIQQYPKIKLELVLSDATSDLRTEKIDLAIRLGDRPTGPYVCTKLMSTRYRVVATPSYLGDAGKPESIADMSEHDCIVFPFPGFRSLWKFKSSGGEVHEIEISPSLIASNALTIRRAVLEDMGVALLSDWTIKDDLEQGTMVDIFPHIEVTAMDFDSAAWILYPSRSYIPAKTRALIDYLKSA